MMGSQEKSAIEHHRTLVLPPPVDHDHRGQFVTTESKLNLNKWHQKLFMPFKSPTVCFYTAFCCCCALGDVACLTKEKASWYPAYCLLAPCPCCVGWARENLAEKHQLPIAKVGPDDCGWCLAKCIGAKMFCVLTMCIFPCLHVAQMRAEVSYRRHGEARVLPCCCCAKLRPDPDYISPAAVQQQQPPIPGQQSLPGQQQPMVYQQQPMPSQMPGQMAFQQQPMPVQPMAYQQQPMPGQPMPGQPMHPMTHFA